MGAFDGQRLVATWRVATTIGGTADEYAVWLAALIRRRGLSFADFTACAISSVVPPVTQTLASLSDRYLGRPALVVHAGLRLNLELRYSPPRALGSDRLVAVVAARQRYGAPVLVITFGTATTFNLISPGGAFVGGAIAPGVETAAEALHQATAQLPLVDLVAPEQAIGRNSDEAVRAGIMYGYTGLVEGMARWMKQALAGTAEEPARPNHVPVIATGGLAGAIAPLTDVIDVVDQGLTLEGIRLLWEMNS